MTSTAYIKREQEVQHKLKDMTFRQIIEHVTRLEGTVEQLQLTVNYYESVDTKPY